MFDIHLGKGHCNADLLLDFLRHHKSETIYLVGDIVDVRCLRKKMYWPPSHSRVFRQLLTQAEKGTRIIYLPGNHDDILCRSRSLSFGPVDFTEQVEHRWADGRRYLAIHGDQYDVVLQSSKWLGLVGNGFYNALITLNKTLKARCLSMGWREPWAPGIFAKRAVKWIVNRAGNFEDVAIAELEAKRLDGITCGHLHHATMSEMRGFHYIDIGDWVESCTAVVEHHDGRSERLSAAHAKESSPKPSSPSTKQVIR